MGAMSIMKDAQTAVAMFEDPLTFVIEPCTAEEVARVRSIVEPTVYTAEMYNLVRRVEAAAAMYPDDKNPKIVEACAVVRELVPSIEAMRGHVQNMEVGTVLEEAGKEGFLLYYLGWALRILKQQLAVWGY